MGPLPIISAANASQPRMIASVEVPTSKSTSTTIARQKTIVIKEQSQGVKIELFDDLRKTQIPASEALDAIYDKFFTQSSYDGTLSKACHQDKSMSSRFIQTTIFFSKTL